eukprot:6206947-Pleurochrysis_carterae.AAC.5
MAMVAAHAMAMVAAHAMSMVAAIAAARAAAAQEAALAAHRHVGLCKASSHVGGKGRGSERRARRAKGKYARRLV